MSSRREPTTREELEALIDAGWKPEFVFFWGHTPKSGAEIGRECLSQWYPASFVIDEVTYPSAEHYMMCEKARLFGDDAAVSRILAGSDPADAKRLGRSVRGFDKDLWVRRRIEIVVAGNVAKFGQNPKLRSFLIDTGDAVLVEASPRDTIWGIGLGATNPHARNPGQWRGLNLLGFALMSARAQIVTSPRRPSALEH